MDFEQLSKEQRRSLERATKSYERDLDQAISWLDKRGIPENVARTFRLGICDEPEIGHEPAEGRLSIPYLTPSGVVELRFRTLDPDDKVKYWNPAGSSTRLYNVQDMHQESDYIAVCEGELDTLVLSALCEVPAVGVPGANNWKPHFKRLFEDYSRVLIVMDGDQAGREAAKRLKQELPGNGVIVNIGEGLDVNDAYLDHGVDYILERLGLDG